MKECSHVAKRSKLLSLVVVSMSLPLVSCVADATQDATSSAEEASRKKHHDAGVTDSGALDSASGGHWELSGWELQLPTGSPGHPDVGVNPTGLHNLYYYIDSAGALTFMDPQRGVTTSGSLHPRSEMREITSGWPASGTNVMTAEVMVPQVPQKVTIGQIFQAPNAPSKPLLELEYLSSGQLKLLLERDKNGSNGAGADFLPVGNITPGTSFRYQISLTANVIHIAIDGVVSSFALPPTFVGVPGTVVKFQSLGVTHAP